jgi:lycopene beta-cyclase
VAIGRPTAADVGGAVLGRVTYLVLMATCLLVTLPLELVLKAGVYRRPRRWLAALVPVFLVFNLWDWSAIRRGHWTYSPRYTTGIELLGLPLEELVFFVVVPTCALLTYQAVVRLLPSPDRRNARPTDPGGAPR